MSGLNTTDGYVIFGRVESETCAFQVCENKSEDKAGYCEQAGNSLRSPEGIYQDHCMDWVRNPSNLDLDAEAFSLA